ncbi:MAG: arginine--tRNA ligase [Caldilineaceae bacterium]
MIRDQVKALVQSAVTTAQAQGALPAFAVPPVDILRPKQADHGDYSTNVAMMVAATMRKATGEKSNPRAIAEAVVVHLPSSVLIAKVEIAGPGFINLRLSDQWLQEQVTAILQAGTRFGDSDLGQGQRWQVEFVSANPNGPIHYGGARNAVLGDSLARVLRSAGYDVQTEFYVNDAGTQFRLFIETLYARYLQVVNHDQAALQADIVIEEDPDWWRQEDVIPDQGYAGAYMIDYAKQVYAEHGEHFAKLPKEAALAELRSVGHALIMPELEVSLARIDVHFDRWFSEQSLYDEGLVEQLLDQLETQGELAQHDGAVWFLASNYPRNDKDEVVIRSNGTPTYFASDIAYHYDKFLRRNFDRVINVWGVDHQGHVPRMAAIMQSLGLDPARLTILMHDLVKLMRDGREVKLSKRAGNLITLNEVVNEIGSDALRFNLLTRSPESTIEVDLDLAVAQTKENPVYYVQYSHARICSILAKAATEGFDIAVLNQIDRQRLHRLTHPSELALIRKLLALEEQIETAVEKLSPHNLPHYAMDLAKSFNGFYRDCRVVDPEHSELSQARLALSEAARIGLAKVLWLMGVSAPATMSKSES